MVGSAQELLERLRGQLVVSCQAASDSPLAREHHIVALAEAAVLGGGKAVRIEGVANVAAVRRAVAVPIIGIVKTVRRDSEIIITARVEEVDALSDAGADIIAFDATDRPRPEPVPALIAAVQRRGRVAMADISTLAEGEAAIAAGADFVGTTLSGYTPYSPALPGPDFALMAGLKQRGIPFVAEGRIWAPAEARRALELGAHFVVVGSAITRPDVITRRFADAVAGLEPAPALGSLE